jgi:hypothetical protein
LIFSVRDDWKNILSDADSTAHLIKAEKIKRFIFGVMRHHRRHAVAHSRHHQHRANEGSLHLIAFNISLGDTHTE